MQENKLTFADYKRMSIETLGIPKRNKCPYCGKWEYFNIEQRNNIAECIISNGNGIWTLVQCGSCGYVRQYYPTNINGTVCTVEECEKLTKEIKRYMATKV